MGRVERTQPRQLRGVRPPPPESRSDTAMSVEPMRIVVESKIHDTPRVEQVGGLFDIPADKTSRQEWTVHLPLAEKSWHVGLIVGPSGCGKSTIARHFWPRQFETHPTPWSSAVAVVDHFPPALGIKDVTTLLSSGGLSSPPAWLRPYHVLSTGQRFRCDLARALALAAAPIVFDEFTSVVDRTVAQIGSAAVAREVRRRKLRFVAVTCHEDVEPWLQPDWTYRPAENVFAWRSLQRRPSLEVEVVRCSHSAWRLFATHHHLSGAHNPSAVCFLGSHKARPVALSAWLPVVGQ